MPKPARKPIPTVYGKTKTKKTAPSQAKETKPAPEKTPSPKKIPAPAVKKPEEKLADQIANSITVSPAPVMLPPQESALDAAVRDAEKENEEDFGDEPGALPAKLPEPKNGLQTLTIEAEAKPAEAKTRAETSARDAPPQSFPASEKNVLDSLLGQSRLDADSPAGVAAANVKEERVLEAALFMSGKPLTALDLGKLVGIAAPGIVVQMIEKLSKEYDERGSALSIVNDNGSFSFRLRPAYSTKVKQFAQEAEISRHALRTLAFIAKNEGVKKSVLCNKLGSMIYDDVRELEEKGFLASRKAGRTSTLHLTPKFRQYFSS